jgi:hypothetical protein
MHSQRKLSISGCIDELCVQHNEMFGESKKHYRNGYYPQTQSKHPSVLFMALKKRAVEELYEVLWKHENHVSPRLLEIKRKLEAFLPNHV